MIKIVYEYSYSRISFQIKIAFINDKISSGATYSDGYDYCGFPAENNNLHSSELKGVLYQCGFFINMFKNIIDKNEIGTMMKQYVGTGKHVHDKSLEDRNAVNSELGLHILNCAVGKILIK
jgi:hypothetical protein